MINFYKNMFSQTPDGAQGRLIIEEGSLTQTQANVTKSLRKKRSKRRKRKFAQKPVPSVINNNFLRKKFPRFNLTMSSWAENYTVAATWQIKHQLAYWKARAKALEYENSMLHEIIRKNYCKEPTDCNFEPDSNVNESETPVDSVSSSESEPDVSKEDNENFEVSEEFIQFLADNAKYKEEARRERERLRAMESQDDVQMMEAPPEATVNPCETWKQLYGDRWERISALETSLQSQFVSACDSEKPTYWPNIPFNFNFS